jgi:heme a synthase
MASERNRVWLSRYALLTAVATLGLICLGGLVTSHEAGLAVPDWPTSYGYNLFFFPLSQWVGGIFYEHTHRLLASTVGLITAVLAIWIWGVDERRWMRWLGVGAVFSVVLQGVLGGLRVTALKDELGIFHATLAQIFLAQVSILALLSSRGWRHPRNPAVPICVPRGLGYLFLTVTGLVLLQLVLGATMRHEHAGLAIPDFPLAHGRLWPAMDDASIARYNQLRTETTHVKSITATGVGVQMAHRLTAVAILLGTGLSAGWALHAWGRRDRVAQLAVGWLGLLLVQGALGAATVWTHKAADVATAHVAIGSLSLVTGCLILLLLFRRTHPAVPAANGVAGSVRGNPLSNRESRV